ncbi:MAG: putative bifunctional diguanylate cyclase/phosphodiesterase [Halioglobus sp.]
MTIAGKINAMVAITAILAATLFLTTSLHREYTAARQHLVRDVSHAVASKPLLQIAVYNRDAQSLAAELQRILELSPAISYSAIRGPAGTGFTQIQQRGITNHSLESLTVLREGVSVAEVGVIAQSGRELPDQYSALADMGASDLIWDVTVPVFSRLNPNEPNLGRGQFVQTLVQPQNVTSLHVMGYMQAGVSRALLWADILPKASRLALYSLGFVVFCLVASRFATSRITAPFKTIVRMADDIAAGRPVETRGLETKGEFKDIVTLLNTIIGGLNTYKTKMDVDHQLLSMKVEERTSQLSKRNDELNRAVKEVTETKDRLRKLAYYDSLTALPNRRLFTEQLDLLLRMAKRNKETLALLFLDLDNFKRINDSLGHSAGDLLLREVAKRLARCVRDSDLIGHYAEAGSEIDVSRLGGDEFTVVLNSLDNAASAAVVAQRVIDSLTHPITIEGHELVVTPSVGIALAPLDAESVDELLKAADTAMYAAKSAGKNSYLFYTSDMDEAGVERLTLENELRKAIDRNELVLHYQPQVDTSNGEVVGAEALMRWEHPERGLVPPFKFIPLAEELGLISALGDWGIQEACRQMMELLKEGYDLPKVSVNVSALQFDHTFTSRVSNALADSGCQPKRLELELTEGIMMDGTDGTISAFQTLKDMGVKLSVDDFGTGYSSLSYLSRFPLDELKIDRSFVIDFDKSEDKTGLIVAIIAMAKSLRLSLVAEGVETHDQYRFLRQNDANVIQGYLFSKPVPLEELKPLLKPGHFLDQINDIKLT